VAAHHSNPLPVKLAVGTVGHLDPPAGRQFADRRPGNRREGASAAWRSLPVPGRGMKLELKSPMTRAKSRSSGCISTSPPCNREQLGRSCSACRYGGACGLTPARPELKHALRLCHRPEKRHGCRSRAGDGIHVYAKGLPLGSCEQRGEFSRGHDPRAMVTDESEQSTLIARHGVVRLACFR